VKKSDTVNGRRKGTNHGPRTEPSGTGSLPDISVMLSRGSIAARIGSIGKRPVYGSSSLKLPAGRKEFFVQFHPPAGL
jgi:hypothetical protein